MKRVIQVLRAGFVAVGIALALPSHAVPIPVGSTSADDFIINFNFLSPPQANPPPYSSVQASLNFSGWDAGETLVVDVFSGLDGSPLSPEFTLTTGVPLITLNLLIGSASTSGDGLFSVGLRLVSGAADLTGSVARGYDTSGNVVATINGSVVPEPATLALLVLGLAGIGFSRRRIVN